MTEFVEDEQPSWDAATINPPAVLGEVIHQIDPSQNAATSVGQSAPHVISSTPLTYLRKLLAVDHRKEDGGRPAQLPERLR